MCELPGASGKELGNYFRAPGFLRGDLAPSCRLLVGGPGLGAAGSLRKRFSQARTTQGTLSRYLLLNQARGWRQLLIMTQLMSVNKIKPHQVGPCPT